MPATRSATRAVSSAIAQSPGSLKRKASPSPVPSPKKTRTKAAPKDEAPSAPQVTGPLERGKEPVLLPASLNFSFEDARSHLSSVDARFSDLFDRLKCKPFQLLEPVDPFKTLVTSILGQQISWLAARSITHRFVRLYDPSLPEKVADMPASKETLFPTPYQVSNTDIATLRSAGLSGRKAEYVKDIAARFADGRLSTEKLSTVSDEDLYELLIDVRGVGPWTVHMFSIFTLRRPNILPVGDLGVQRGVLRWFYYWHNPSTTSSPVKIHPEKLPKSLTPGGDVEETAAQPGADEVDIPKEEEPSPAAGASALLPAPPVTPKKGGAAHDTNCDFPEAFTPSIKRTLASQELNRVTPPPPLPKGLSVSELKSRLDGKKKQKGAFLTPAEMEELTECWKPYRSLGVYYMWALSEEKE